MSAPSETQQDQCAVDPVRLASGRWCHRQNKTIGEGDISASYSADRIGMGQPIRKPFPWRGALWVCVGTGYHRGAIVSATAYRLIDVRVFDSTPVSYGERCARGDAARCDPNRFYHGMRVRHGGGAFVLSGPPVLFIPGETEQLDLF